MEKETLRLHNPEKSLDSYSREAKETRTKGDLDEFEIDVLLDRSHPYRRLLFTRRKSKGRVEPWINTQNS
jgi:hypothetical protein